MANEEAARLAEDWNEDLEKMEVGDLRVIQKRPICEIFL